MPEVIASFFGSTGRTSYNVIRGDALTIEADVAIIGKAPAVRQRLERFGAVFSPFARSSGQRFWGHVDGRIARATVPNGPWRHVFAIDYRAGHNDRLEFRSQWVAVGSHPAKLAFDLSYIISDAAKEAQPLRFLFLPLSWRNPNVVCAATVAACHGFATLWDRHEPPSGWQFLLCDQHDPSPFIRFLRNEDDCLAKFIGQTMLMSSSSYHQHPIRETSANPLSII